LTVHARETPRSDALDLFVEGLSQNLPSPSHPAISAGGKVDEFVKAVSSHESLKAIIKVLETFVEAMDQVAKIHPIINVAWQVVHGLYQIPKNQLDRDDKVVRLIARIRDLYATVRALDGVEKVAELESIIEAILQQTIECVLFIREYVGSGFGKRVLHQTVSSTNAKIKEFEDALRDLETSFRNRSLVHIALVTTRVSNRVEKMYAFVDLMGQLTPVDMETFDLPRCQPGTRSSEIQWITEWVMDPSADQRILWLPGPAGFGKSTLSATLADTFASLRRLGAFLFFSRDVEERSAPSKVVKTLAYQLALFDHRIADKVSKLLDESPFMARSHVRNQFAQLIVKSLCSVEALDDDGPLVIILDALDECGDAESRRSLLSALVAESRHLPSCVRILITSRPSDDIAGAFDKQPHVKCRSLEITAENSKDVKAFLRHSLAQIAQSRRHLTLDPGWPGCPVLRVLTTHAGGLFIWADTAVKYMDDGMNPVQRLDVLVSGVTPKDRVDSLSQLYATVLHACQRWDDEEFCSAFCRLFGVILVAKLPLPPSAMDSLLSLPPNWALQMTSYFKAVLTEEPTGAIRIIHPSFYDFLTSQSQAGSPWYINAQLHNKYMAFHCVDLLGLTLKENMLGLVHSLRPAPMPSLSSDIAYACLFWIPHVCAVGGELESLGDSISQLLHTHLLHWLEAMCISKESRKALHMLDQLESWIQVNLPDYTSLCDLVSDSLKFCRYFSNVIEQHPLSVYQIALPFSPTGSLIYKAFHRDDVMPRVSGKLLLAWPPWQLTLAGHTQVKCMALSPDGLRIATGGKQEDTAYIWDVMTGSLVAGPLQGHQSVWSSAAFSADGLRLVSCSGGKTVWIWDVLTGAMTLGPLVHEHGVDAVCFSPNGSHIVSGTLAGTIYIWDAATGAQLHGPRKRHYLGIGSVAVSPDGSMIVSGSYDQTVCLSDVATGNLILGPLVGGLTSGVCMVSFLPDGFKFISGAQDKTISIWDSHTCMVGPLCSRISGNISTISICPDGSKAVTGCKSGVLSFWDMQSGTLILESKCHQDGVNTVTFSYDGTRVASASKDMTICIWDASSGTPVAGPLSGHGDAVHSVAFSPDGLRIASGSSVIYIWDAVTGAIISTYGQLQPDEGHYSAMKFTSDGSKLTLLSMKSDPDREALWIWDSHRGVKL
ncbi:hypothetical protein BOTBODRAFT_74046, partial [Botryobasidium botryosum FD-172 SS1]